MGRRRFLSNRDGIVRWMEYDPFTDQTTEVAVQDVEPHLEASRRLQNDPENWKTGVKKDFALYAQIPNIILEQWANKGVDINDVDALFEMANKPEYAYLKTTTRQVLARA